MSSHNTKVNKRKLQNIPKFMEEFLKLSELVILNYIYMWNKKIPCSFTVLQNILRNQSFELTLNHIGMMSLVSSSWLRLVEREDSCTDNLSEDLFNIKDSPKISVPTEPELVLLMDIKTYRKSRSARDVLKTAEECIEKFKDMLDIFLAKEDLCSQTSFNDRILAEASKLIPRRNSTEDHKINIRKQEVVQVTVRDIVQSLRKSEFYFSQICSSKVFPSRKAQYQSLRSTLAPALLESLEKILGIKVSQLYKHQAEAIDSLMLDNKSVTVSTSTSSGKSLIFYIPFLNKLLAGERNIRAFFIFPTKALAQDQLQKFRNFLNVCGLADIVVNTFDGDTPFDQRPNIIGNSSVILTNPDMLHINVLPNHLKWKDFLSNLAFVVLDEVHTYSGNFGSNVGMVIRRLKRVVSMYNSTSNLLFVACSATISNPLEHSMNLLDIPTNDIRCICEDGSPCGEKEIVLWNCVERSFTEAAKIFVHFIKNNIKTVLFCKYRRICEIEFKQVQELLSSDENLSWLKSKVRAYRGGFSPEKRREIETQLFNNDLVGVIATNALELGIDVGELEATLHLGLPFSKSSFWQQAGRAGRRSTYSTAIWIADENPMDRYILLNPDYLYQQTFEKAISKPYSSPCFDMHLNCAAAEKMINLTADKIWFGNRLQEICKKSLQHMGEDYYFVKPEFLPNPASLHPLRSIEQENVKVLDQFGDILEEMELSRALFTLYEGGVYLNEGKVYIVEHADLKKDLIATVRPSQVKYITMQRDFTDVDPLEQIESRRLSLGVSSSFSVSWGSISIKKKIFGFIKYNPKTKKILDTVDVYADPVIIQSMGVWMDLPLSWDSQFKSRNLDFESAIHSLNHLLCKISQVIVLSGPDVDTEHKSELQQRVRPHRLILYDRSGSSEEDLISMYNEFEKIISSSAELFFSCKCSNGCALCIVDIGCNKFNERVCKESCACLLSAILEIKKLNLYLQVTSHQTA